jgi:hypothetical protein
MGKPSRGMCDGSGTAKLWRRGGLVGVPPALSDRRWRETLLSERESTLAAHNPSATHDPISRTRPLSHTQPLSHTHPLATHDSGHRGIGKVEGWRRE